MSASTSTTISVDEAGYVLTIIRPGHATLQAHAMWLRDRCDCADCRRSTTNERLLDQAALDPKTVIREASVTDAHDLTLVFSDGHHWTAGVGELVGQMEPESDGPMSGRTRWPIVQISATTRRCSRCSSDSPPTARSWSPGSNPPRAACVTRPDSSDRSK
ncbi:MAG: gamma-butyrobetaine hydroxylase-like domain-containing protein [Actinomycetota bacterium]|nr:gamma-butyrobetaine hydroxylase-like domain-containing protein [Actinomycetota bacterium]